MQMKKYMVFYGEGKFTRYLILWDIFFSLNIFKEYA